ncbi:VOC family protein [Streptomyces pratensis]|uniref:VOC family protein n=1 Tax=Streptomyces pratensis TaxID=1169025 RepID=UPI003019F453
MKIRLDHLRVDVLDMDVAEKFYREALGFERVVRFEVPDGVIQQMGPGGSPPGVELTQKEGLVPAPSETEHICFQVDDVVAWVERVRAAGYPIEREPFKIGDEGLAFVKDPDGHLIEFNDFNGR